jgi:hypothetical protein
MSKLKPKKDDYQIIYRNYTLSVNNIYLKYWQGVWQLTIEIDKNKVDEDRLQALYYEANYGYIEIKIIKNKKASRTIFVTSCSLDIDYGYDIVTLKYIYAPNTINPIKLANFLCAGI